MHSINVYPFCIKFLGINELWGQPFQTFWVSESPDVVNAFIKWELFTKMSDLSIAEACMILAWRYRQAILQKWAYSKHPVEKPYPLNVYPV